MVWVRGPSSSTGRILVSGSIARATAPVCATQPRASFVQLEVRDMQGAQAALVQALSMPACAREKGW
jgi:hypothetical protein